MCYYSHTIFLHCGHSISSLHPIRPSPPCPSLQPQQQQPRIAEGVTLAPDNPHRPFSFDPSVIASPTSPLPEPFPAQTPWRLEGPFSTPESASSPADEEEDVVRKDMKFSLIAPAVESGVEQENIPPIQHQNQGEREPEETREGQQPQPQRSCGQILIHPYRTYKIEGLCLHCSRRRDTRLASFEVHAIRDTVYRESVPGPTARKGVQSKLGMHPQVEEELEGERGGGAENDGRLKPLPPQLPMSMLGKNAHFQNQAQRLRVPLQQQQQTQQQTPWRLTLPPAEIPRTGRGLAGMRDGEWI
jgi:hypothetical protein